MLGISWGLPRSGNLMTGRQDYQGDGVISLIRSPFSGIKEITERMGERKINEAYRSHPDKIAGVSCVLETVPVAECEGITSAS